METSASRERVDLLGDYFVYHDIYGRFGLTFESFLDKVHNNTWQEYITIRQQLAKKY